MRSVFSRWFVLSVGVWLGTACGAETADEPEIEFGTTTSAAVPQQLVGTDPIGIVGSRNPTFIWSDNDPANSQQFRIWINDGTASPRVDLTFARNDPEIDCASTPGECTYTSATALGAGNGRWWVRGVHLVDGPGPWSIGQNFSIGTNIVVATVVPTGDTMVTQPQYRWTGNVLGDFYQLFVRNSDTGAQIIDQEFTAAQALCAVGTNCRVTPAAALPFGNYRFWVRTNRGGQWSAPRNFRVIPATPLGQPTLIAPLGAAAANPPTFEWNPVTAADSYDVWVNDSAASPAINTNVDAAVANCAGGAGTCSFTPGAPLATGAARWWVRARGGSLVGNWSLAGDFTVP